MSRAITELAVLSGPHATHIAVLLSYGNCLRLIDRRLDSDNCTICPQPRLVNNLRVRIRYRARELLWFVLARAMFFRAALAIVHHSTTQHQNDANAKCSSTSNFDRVAARTSGSIIRNTRAHKGRHYRRKEDHLPCLPTSTRTFT